MPTYGTVQRAFRRLNVIRGFKGNEPQSLSLSAVPKTGEAILSGMVISLDSNGEWVKGALAGKVPYLAYHDQADSTVASSGKLLGLSCAGDYEVETAFFLTSATIAPAAALMADISGGSSGDKGYVAKAVARTTPALASPFDLIGYASGGTTSSKVDVSNSDSNTAKDSNGNVYVLRWTTRWQPNQYAFGLAAS